MLFAVLALWMAVCALIASYTLKVLSLRGYRAPVGVIVFFSCLVLPVGDELVARPKFEALCREGVVLKIDAQKIRGKMIRVDVSPLNRPVQGTAIPILHSRYSYRDAASGVELAAYDVYTAKGGVLVRLIGFPEANHPLTIERATCVPQNEGTLAARYGFVLLN